MLKKFWRFGALLAAFALVAIGNVVNLQTVLPFYSGYHIHRINDMIEDQQWVEAPPVVLSNNFKNVHVSHVGKPKEDGFGFQQELVNIFKVDSVDYSGSPIDVRGKLTPADLEAYRQYPAPDARKQDANTHCNRKGSKYCTMAIYWDDTYPTTSAEFVGVHLTDNGYALVERSILEQLLGVRID